MPATVKLAEGKTLPDAVLYVMCVAQMFVGVTVVTDELFPAFKYRVRMFEAAHGNRGLLVETFENGKIQSRNFTDEELETFRGARFNVPAKTHAQFKKELATAWYEMEEGTVLRDLKIFDHSHKGEKK